jgi:DNA repair protein RecO (recombination protein O)
MPAKVRVELQPAYTLHQKPYRDTSALVELVTPEFGRVTVIAKGLKRPKSKWQGQLRAFQPMLVSWVGRTELMTLTHVEISGKHLHLSAKSLLSGFYLNELLIRLLHRFEPQVEMFSAYDIALREISQIDWSKPIAQWQLQSVLRYFEINLLSALGYGLTLGREFESGANIQADEDYQYLANRGPVKWRKTEIGYNEGVKVSGRTLLALDGHFLLNNYTDRQIFNESKKLMRMILACYLGDKPLMSREMFNNGN